MWSVKKVREKVHLKLWEDKYGIRKIKKLVPLIYFKTVLSLIS